MKPFGVIVLIETFIPQSSVDSLFGLLPGYWRQKDLDLRPTHCLINGKKYLLFYPDFFKTKSIYLTNIFIDGANYLAKLDS
jgi:hypothetical protein